ISTRAPQLIAKTIKIANKPTLRSRISWRLLELLLILKSPYAG
ncbi:hypothetical protein D030_1689B, partial [Vibrio parahaemolyticus AQ3810]